MRPKPYKDQHFLEDRALAQKMVDVLEIQKTDSVIEIGAGSGNITRCVPECDFLLIENDKELVSVLQKDFPSARIFARDALRVLPDLMHPETKLLGNIPFQITEPLFQLLCRKRFAKASLLVPLKSAQRIVSEEPFASVFSVSSEEVSVESFSPAPDTRVALVAFSYRKEMLPAQRVISEVLLQSDKLMKNALREALVRVLGMSKSTAKEAVEQVLISRLQGRSNRMLTAEDWSLLKGELEKLQMG